MRRWIALGLAVACLSIVGCAKDSTTAGTGSPSTAGGSSATSPPKTEASPPGTSRASTDTSAPAGGEFCDVVKAAKDDTDAKSSSGSPSKEEIDRFIGELEAARDAGPADLTASWDKVIDAYRQIAAVGADKLTTDKAAEIFLSDDMQAATKKIDAYTQETCGFEVSGSSSSSSGSSGSSGSGGTSTDGTTPGTVVETDTSNLPDACKDVTSSFDTDKTDAASIYNVKLHVCIANPDASWIKSFLGSSFSASGSTSWDIAAGGNDTGTSFTANEALHVCEAVATYLTSVDIDAEIAVGMSKEDSLKPDPLLAARKTGGVCAAP